MDYINIGPTPHDENCAQVGQEGYYIRARKECAAYCRQLRRMYPEPDGGYFAVKSFGHDFGDYYEVIARYDDTDQEAINWAFAAEAGAANWDDDARAELGI